LDLQESLSALSLETYSDIWIFKKACLLLKLTVTFGSSRKLVCSWNLQWHLDLQKSLSALETYSDIWGLKVNIKKTASLTFNKGNRLIKNKLIYKNEIIQNVQTFKYLGSVSTKLFGSLIKPITLYCSEVWGFENNDKCPIEKLHTRLCKHVLGVSRTSTNMTIKTELNRLSLHLSMFIIWLSYDQILVQNCSTPSDKPS
jgi:hypothetical protein